MAADHIDVKVFFEEFGYSVESDTVAIPLLTNSFVSKEVAKHIRIRGLWIRIRVDIRELNVINMPPIRCLLMD